MNKRMKELITNSFKLSKTVEGVTTVYIDGDFTEHYVKKHFGNVFCYYDNTNDLKKDFDFYNSVHGEDVIKLFEGLAVEYNPIENYDGYEDTTIDHTGTVGNVGSADTTTKVSAYDSEDFVDSGFSEGGTSNTTTYNNTDTTTTHRHGNLGIRTSAECLTEESKIRFNQFLEYYLNRWINGVIVGYGDEYDEIDTSEVEYATIEQLNTLAETVGTNTENISTLDNSLGDVIGDVSDLEQDVETLDNTVSGHTTTIDNFGTRIETLEGKHIKHEYAITWESIVTSSDYKLYEKDGVCYLYGYVVINNIGTGSKTIGTIPSEVRPPVNLQLTVYDNNIDLPCSGRVQKNGSLLIYSTSRNTTSGSVYWYFNTSWLL